MDEPWKHFNLKKPHKRPHNSWPHLYELSIIGKFAASEKYRSSCQELEGEGMELTTLQRGSLLGGDKNALELDSGEVTQHCK